MRFGCYCLRNRPKYHPVESGAARGAHNDMIIPVRFGIGDNCLRGIVAIGRYADNL